MKHLPHTRAVALVITLVIILLAAALCVALATAMRTERAVSFNNLEGIRANLFARQGVDYSIALLRETTATDRFWISGPGQIATSSPGWKLPCSTIDLSSGFSTSNDGSVDLNRSGMDPNDRVLDPQGGDFRYKWIYVLDDGTYRTSRSAGTVGRFAFWVDDDSTRVDFNIATHRQNPPATDLARPGLMDLTALGFSVPDIEALEDGRTIDEYGTPYEIFGAPMSENGHSAAFANRFCLTPFTHDPDVNPWGGSRVVLTTQSKRAEGRNYLSILKKEGDDPGLRTNLSSSPLDTAFTNLMSSLTRKDWPYASGGSFADKYGMDGALQLALDIIEYVRTTEAVDPWIEPLVATPSAAALSLSPSDLALGSLTSRHFIGTVRRPMISQVAVWIPATPNGSGTYEGQLYVQVYYPYGQDNISGKLYAEVDSNVANSDFAVNFASSRFQTLTQAVSFAVTRPEKVKVRVALLKPSANAVSPTTADLFDIAPLAASETIECRTESADNAANAVQVSAVNDPRVNKFPANWTISAFTVATNAFGQSSAPGVFSQPVDAQPPQDRTGGAISADSVYFPSKSWVGSVGELGFVNTAVRATNAAGTQGVPWRSLRFQPGSSALLNVPPDWALMDLFSAPIYPFELPSRYFPGPDLLRGRLNVNVNLFAHSTKPRVKVLNALFKDVIPESALAAAMNNVADAKLATNGINFGQAIGGKLLPAVGQLAEIRGIADSGNEKEAEDVIRKVASVATVRGNVFTVYSAGQAVRVSRSGNLTISGQKMCRAVIERYLENGEAKYRVIQWSDIYP